MKAPYRWLREMTGTALSAAELAERLTHSGTVIGGIEDAGLRYRAMRVGRVIEVRPLGERLRLARVAAGAETLEVATAASNVRAGLTAALALPGAELPGGRTIETRSMAGVLSQGMLLSREELGLGPDAEADRVLELADRWEPGTALATALELDDLVLEAEINPNRGDCLSLLGLAREVAAIGAGEVKLPPWEVREAGEPAAGEARIDLRAPGGCPFYSARILDGLSPGPAPLWLAARLLLAGVRPRNLLVDVTNYVLFELGQPLHAFDLDRLASRELVVRFGRGETLRTLDGIERVLGPEVLAICDGERPAAVAGIMGGEETAVQPGTRRVLLESAWFDPVTIRRAAKSLALATDASHRFERAVDPGGVLRASARAARLLAELGGARPRPGLLTAGEPPAPLDPIRLRPARARSLLGAEPATGLDDAAMEKALGRLGLAVTKAGASWTVAPPSHRRDLAIEEDVIEEIARLHGYERFPSWSRIPRTVSPHEGERGRLARRLRPLLAGAGFYEASTVTLIEERRAADWLEAAGAPGQRPLPVMNPISEAYATLRPALLPGLLGSLALNLNRRRPDPRLFELGVVFAPTADAPLPDERYHLACGVSGAWTGPSWDAAAREADIWDLRGLLEAWAGWLALPAFAFEPAALPLFAGAGGWRLLLGGEPVGLAGEIGPAWRERFGLRARALCAELDLERCLADAGAGPRPYRGLPRFPAVERDIALVVDASVAHAALESLIREEGGELVEAVRLFDVYAGDPLPPGRKSLAYGLTLRAADRTLSEEDAHAVRRRIAERAARELGAGLRE